MRSDSFESNIIAAIQAISLEGPGRVKWFGVPLRINWPLDAWSPEVLIGYVANLLYQQFYCYGHPVPLRTEALGKTILSYSAIQQIASRHGTLFRWVSGWRLHSIDNGFADVERGGLRTIVDPSAWLREGDSVKVRFPIASSTLSPGFCLIISGEPFTESDVIRLYWNLPPDAASELVEGLADSLGRKEVPYKLKVLTNLTFSARSDSCVLYLQRRDFNCASEDLVRAYVAISRFVRPSVPAFTLELAPGLSVAEQPPGDESFGQHRCRLFAEGLARAYELRAVSDCERLTILSQHFSSAGCSMEQLHLNPESRFDYRLKFPPPMKMRRGRRNRSFIEIAEQIGDRLVREAVWHENRCSWLDRLAGNQQAFGSLGPGLYSGTSGIAWFLAEMYQATEKKDFRRTAEGALRHAFFSATQSLELGIGLYEGWSGLAYAGLRCASLLDSEEFYKNSQEAVAHLTAPPEKSKFADLLSGEAGAILCLMLLGRLSQASEYGSWLIDAAKRSSGGFSWKTTGKSSQPHLTGFAHGAAGIGFALAALYRATACSVFLDGAMGAFQYERHYFNPTIANWPDFRGVGNKREPRQYACGWCHGAPGIALSRHLGACVIRPLDETKSDELISERNAAIETTRQALLSGMDRQVDFCLCHGMAGNADILLLAGCPEDFELAVQTGYAGAERFNSETLHVGFLGLMTGLAGIGHFYLRLHDRTVPSPLWIAPASREELR